MSSWQLNLRYNPLGITSKYINFPWKFVVSWYNLMIWPKMLFAFFSEIASLSYTRNRRKLEGKKIFKSCLVHTHIFVDMKEIPIHRIKIRKLSR